MIMAHFALGLGRRERRVQLLLRLLLRFLSCHILLFEFWKESIPRLIGQGRIFHEFTFDHQSLRYWRIMTKIMADND